MNVSEVQKTMKKLNFMPSKKKGQHFLIDSNIARWQVDKADIESNETVLEIGAGLGILTRLILEKTENIIIIEKDPTLAGYLKNELGVEVICADVLDIELPEFDKVVSNLPYHISSEITAKLLAHDFDRGILMFQKEFAKHLVAKPGSRAYSRISVLAGYHADSEIVKLVPKGAFYPVPKVDSAVVEIVPRAPEFTPPDKDFYFLVVRVIFSHKNRKIRNALVSEHRQLGASKVDLKSMVDDIPHADERAVTLSPIQINDIADMLVKIVKN